MSDDIHSLPNEVTDPVKEVFGQRMRVAMAISRKTPIELALVCGVTRQAVWLWSIGAALPGSNRIVPLTKALGCTTDWLMSQKPLDFGEGGPRYDT
jgi:transcriptional regulator with XRE-family HTH domain